MSAPGQKKSFLTLAGEYSSLAFLLPAATFAGYAVGYLLDRAFGTSYLKVVCLILGTIGGFVELIRKFLKDSNDTNDG